MSMYGAVFKDELLSGELFEATVSRAVKGDEEALSELCDNISRQVFLLAVYLLGESEGAEDIAQESLIDVCKGIHTLQEPKAFKNWLYTIVSGKKNKYLSERVKHGVLVDINEWLEELVEERDGFIPGADLESAELRGVVKRIILGLPVRQREAIILRYYNDLKQKEIASVMGVSFPCVCQYIALAKKKIKCDVEQYLRAEKPNTTKHSTMLPLGALLEGVLHREAQLMALANENVIQRLVATCSEYIASSAVAVASAAQIGGVATASVVSLKPIVITGVCSIALAAALSIGILVAEDMPAQLHQPPIVREMPSLTIILEGGVREDEGLIMVNPTNAHIAPEEVSIVRWWITEYSSNDIIEEGEGNTMSEGFAQIYESGNYGPYMLTIEAKTEGFTPHTVFVSFYNFPG